LELRHVLHSDLEEELMVSLTSLAGRTSDDAVRPAAWAWTQNASLWLAALFLLDVAVRFHGLGAQSLWADEIAAVEIAKQPLRVLWSTWMVRETNPPLYYSALHLWMEMFGRSDIAVRGLSAVIGTMVAPLMYVLGRAIASKRVGLIAALLAALWSHQLFYSQEARGYILGTVGALIAVIGLVNITDQVTAPTRSRTAGQRLWPWFAYAFGAVIAVYTHTTHVLLPLLASLYFVWLWAFRGDRRPSSLLAWTATNAAVVCIWAWWGWITWLQVHLEKPNFGWIGKPSLSQGVSIVLNLYGPAGVTLAKSLGRTVLLGMGGLFIAAAAWGASRLRPERAGMLAVFGIGAPLLLFAISQHVPIMLPRTLLWAQFSVIIALAAAMDAIPSGIGRAVATSGVALVLVLGWSVQAPREPWRSLVEELAILAGPGEVVLVSSVSDGVYIQHYCVEARCRFKVENLISPTDIQNRWADDLFTGASIPAAALPSLLGQTRSVWTVSRWGDDPRPAMSAIAVATPFPPLHTILPDAIVLAKWRAAPL
jgi:mannosyltransferase